MRRRVLKVWDLPSNGASAALIIMAAVFLIGGLAGCTLVGRTDGNGEAALADYLNGYLNVAASGQTTKPDFLVLFWKTIRWPLFALCFGLTPIGLICIPFLFLARAFLLSFSIASFFHLLGSKGLFFAFAVFGLNGLIYIPVLFILGIQGFLNSGMIAGRLVGDNRRSTTFRRVDVLRCGICFIVLLVCCFIEYSAGPAILKSAADILLG